MKQMQIDGLGEQDVRECALEDAYFMMGDSGLVANIWWEERHDCLMISLGDPAMQDDEKSLMMVVVRDGKLYVEGLVDSDDKFAWSRHHRDVTTRNLP